MAESLRFNPAEEKRKSAELPKDFGSGRMEAINDVRMQNKGETIAEKQHKDVAGMLELFVQNGQREKKWDSLQSAREEFKFIQEKALGQSFADKVALEGPDAQEKGFIYTDQEVAINVEDKNIGETLKAEFLLVVDAEKSSKNYGKYKLVPANDDARRLR